MHESEPTKPGSRSCPQCGRDTGALGLPRCTECGGDLSKLVKTDCVRCGFDAGISELRNCPECGWTLSVRDVDPATFRRARRYFVFSVLGLFVSGFGTCFNMPVYYSSWSREELFMITGLMIFAGLGSVRSHRLFRSMRRFESSDDARWYAGAATLVFGVQLAFLLVMVL